MKVIENHLSKNKRVKKLLHNVNSGAFSLDTEKYLKEIEEIHMSRIVRTIRSKHVLEGTGNAKKTLINASAQNTAARSRLVEINMMAGRKRAALEEAMEMVKLYLQSRYATWLKQTYGAAPNQTAAIRYTLISAERVINALERIEYYADKIIEDVDKAAWTLKSYVDILNIAGKPEREI